MKPLEEIIAKAAQQDSAPRSPSALDAGSVGSDSLAGGLAPISEFAEPTTGLPADAQGVRRNAHGTARQPPNQLTVRACAATWPARRGRERPARPTQSRHFGATGQSTGGADGC